MVPIWLKLQETGAGRNVCPNVKLPLVTFLQYLNNKYFLYLKKIIQSNLNIDFLNFFVKKA